MIGKCYTRWDDAEYLILYKTNNWIAVLHDSSNHGVGDLEFWPIEELNEDYNKKLMLISDEDWPITNYIDEFEYKNDQTIVKKS